MKRLLFITLTMVSVLTFAQDVQEASFSELILGENITWSMFTVFLLFGLLGLVTSVAIDIYSSGIAGKDFSFSIFWQDNKWRLLLSLLVIVIAIIFSEQLLEMQMGNWSSFIAGFASDKVIENLMQRRRRKKLKEYETES